MAIEKGWKSFPGVKSQVQSQAASEGQSAARRGKFDEKTFHQRLLNFIMVDDQVYSFLLY